MSLSLSLLRALSTLSQSWLSEWSLEVQNSLLSELFSHSLPYTDSQMEVRKVCPLATLDCSCSLNTEAKGTATRMQPSAWPPKTNKWTPLQVLPPRWSSPNQGVSDPSLRPLQEPRWADPVLRSALVIWQVFPEAGP